MATELAETPVRRVQVLAVDDVDANLIALDAILKGAGVEVLKARSGTEALELLLTHDVAIALIDVQMPEMDGFALAELMRGSARTRSIPIIFVTAGNRDPQRAFQGYEAGAVDFLFKPLASHVLRSKVGTFVQLEQNRQQLGAKVAALEDALRLNETVMAVLGHDLRSPLAAILNGAHLLLSGSEEEKTRRVLARICASAERMSRMISQLLDLARVRATGSIPIDRVMTDLRPICEAILVEHEAQAGPGRLGLEIRGDTRGLWDADRLGQIVSNLVGNALNHGTRDGAVRVEIDGSGPSGITLSVRNRGAIPPGILPHVFEAFRGQRTRDGSEEGLGLGLFIVDRLVRAHGGSIRARSEGGETTFEVRLPAGAGIRE
jgi:signal transduction histidine kinase